MVPCTQHAAQDGCRSTMPMMCLLRALKRAARSRRALDLERGVMGVALAGGQRLSVDAGAAETPLFPLLGRADLTTSISARLKCGKVR